MRNITEQQKAKAKAYNDTIKSSMSLENKLELLFDEVLDYVNDKIGDDGLKALDKIIVRFTKDDYKIVCKLFIDENFSVASEINYQYNIATKVIKEALEVLKIDLSKDGELMRRINAKLVKDSEKASETIEQALKDDGVLRIIKEYIAIQYYSYFASLQIIIKNIIDNYSENGESLEPKVKELITKKEAKA